MQNTGLIGDNRNGPDSFAGAHSDVGGGYPITGRESGLSDAGFDWIIGCLGGLGAAFAATPAFPTAPSAAGVAH